MTKSSSKLPCSPLVVRRFPGAAIGLGLDRGATIRTVNEQNVADNESLQKLLEVVPFEQLGWEISPETQALREGWLDSRALTRLPELHRHCPKCRREFQFEYDFCPFDGEGHQLTTKEVESPGRNH